MNCPTCGGNLELEQVREVEAEDQALVDRKCTSCHLGWTVLYQASQIMSITQREVEVGEYGFDYTCPGCGFTSHVYTVYRTHLIACFKCGVHIPRGNITQTGGYELLPERIFSRGGGSRGGRHKGSIGSTYTRTPRAHRPAPDGSTSLADLAESLGIESKKLRSWLRKVGWRSQEEAKTSWIFSADEVQEVTSRLKGST